MLHITTTQTISMIDVYKCGCHTKITRSRHENQQKPQLEMTVIETYSLERDSGVNHSKFTVSTLPYMLSKTITMFRK